VAVRSGGRLAQRVGATGVMALVGVLGLLAVRGPSTSAGSAPRRAATLTATVSSTVPSFQEVWSVQIPDGSQPVALSSPNLAQLPGGPAVVVGDRAGFVYALSLASGARVWTYDAGAPVDATPSVAALTPGSPDDSIFVGTGNAADPEAGGYQAISPTGGDQWFVQETNPPTDPVPHNGVQASLAVGTLQGQLSVVAGSLGEEEDALVAATGQLLPGFPWYQADSNFTTPALADVEGTGQLQIIEGGDSTAGVSYGQQYQNGGHLRILSDTGNAGQPEPNDGLVCELDTDQTVQSSPAVGPFLTGGALGIVAGTGQTYPGASQTDALVAMTPSCQLAWQTSLPGATNSSPALADVEGNGQLQVLEGTDTGSTGSVVALDGSNGSILWQTQVGRVIGSVVTADLSGQGYQDVLASTTNGVVVLDGRTGAVLTTLEPGVGFQNSPLVTDDPNGTIGITLAGYSASGSVITHYEVPGSNGASVDAPGSWPQFHANPQLTGAVGVPAPAPAPAAPPSCRAPATPQGYWLAGADGGVFTFGNLPFCGSTGGLRLAAPIVGMAGVPGGGGYWLVGADGGVFSFGDARFFGSVPGLPAGQRPPAGVQVVGLVPTADGRGYWEVTSAGDVYSFGDAPFFGSAGDLDLAAPIVGMAATPDGQGYWLVGADGGVFSFGDAPFDGSTGNLHLAAPIVGMAVP